jgi:stage II sporulation protein D
MRRLALTVVAALAGVAAAVGTTTAVATVGTTTAAATVGTTAVPAPPASTPAFVLAGGGWGHGVGMSQWGAFGQARAGRDYRTILSYYYPGTTLGPSPVLVPSKLRILVADGLAALTVTASGAIALVDGSGTRERVDAGVTLGPRLRLKGKPGFPPEVLNDPVTLRAADGGQLTVGDKSYRGALRVSRSGGKLQLVNLVSLESYLLGVVPGEMPKEWPLEALKAQAVAARTYAVANIVAGKPFDLYSDARSQLYYGAEVEAPGPTRAVTETRGQILSFDGSPAQTLYFSSSGGRTLSALDAFGEDLPYLVSVADPWDALSPNHRWQTQVMTGVKLGRRLGLGGAVSDVSYEPGTPGNPAALRVTTREGSVVERLADVRNRLGLKSLEFQLGVLRLDGPADSSRAPGVVRLTGVARSVSDVRLERRTPGGDWASVARIAPTGDGTFAIRVRVATTTTYRLSSGGVGGPALTVRIAA